MSGQKSPRLTSQEAREVISSTQGTDRQTDSRRQTAIKCQKKAGKENEGQMSVWETKTQRGLRTALAGVPAQVSREDGEVPEKTPPAFPGTDPLAHGGAWTRGPAGLSKDPVSHCDTDSGAPMTDSRPAIVTFIPSPTCRSAQVRTLGHSVPALQGRAQRQQGHPGVSHQRLLPG